MCTMTWFVSSAGYELFFNRDERISRSRAAPPSVQTINGIDYISPTDTDAGGTWIAVNNRGITVCLLNHYEFQQIASYKAWTSRGEIVRSFANTVDIDVAEQRFKSLNLENYRAFRMFLIDSRGNNRLCVWDGHQSRVEREVSTPKSSSSVSAKEVKTLRRTLFSESGVATSKSRQDFINYHASHQPTKSQESVCMHRADANTVSFSHVSVGQKIISFAYADGPPCEAVLGDPLVIDVSASHMPERTEYQSINVMASS